MKRFFAMLIDVVITQIFFHYFIGMFFLNNRRATIILVQLSSFFVLVLYNIICDSSFDGTTIGKKIMKIKVIVPDRKKQAYIFLHGILRCLLFSFLPLTGIYYLAIGRGRLPYDNWFETELEYS